MFPSFQTVFAIPVELPSPALPVVVQKEQSAPALLVEGQKELPVSALLVEGLKEEGSPWTFAHWQPQPLVPLYRADEGWPLTPARMGMTK